MLSELRFASLLVYSPRGTGDISRRSQSACIKVKSGQPATLLRATEVLREHAAAGQILAPVFGDVTLVPMPRSAPLVAGALWPAERICQSIVEAGLATRIETTLRRRTAVPKSATSARGERPSVSTHYESFAVEARLHVGGRIVLVDDVVTKGSTAIAAASRMAEAYPNAQISLFALIRTKGLVPEIDAIIDPAMGLIELVDDEGSRQP